MSEMVIGTSVPAAVYERSDSGWDQVGADLIEYTENGSVTDIVTFDGTTFVGATNDIATGDGAGQVYAYSDGSWQNVGSGLNNEVTSLAVYDGELYAATSGVRGELYRFVEAGEWSRVVTRNNWNGFTASQVYDGKLFVGDLVYDIFGYYDGDTFVQEADQGGSCIFDFEIHQGELYASAWSGVIYRRDGGDWPEIADIEHDDIFLLHNHNGTLYTGDEGGTLASYDTTSGSQEVIAEFDDSIVAITSAGDDLIIGTGANAAEYGSYSEDGDAAVYRLSEGSVEEMSGDHQFGAAVQIADDAPVEPGATRRSGSSSVVSWVPGLNENDNERDGADLHSAFPNEGPIPVPIPIDAGFLGDQQEELGDDLEEAMGKKKEVQGLEGEYKCYRVKHTIEVAFDTSDGSTIDDSSDIEVRVNARQPDTWGHEDRTGNHESLSPSVSLLNPDDPEELSTTIAEENLEESANISLPDLVTDERVHTAHANERFLNLEFQQFEVGGETVEGVRVAGLWGGENSITKKVPGAGTQPIIYHWIDMAVLANGSRAVRVHDTSPFPLHTLFTGPAGDRAAQTNEADSGLEILWDLDASSEKGEFEAAINEKSCTPWKQFHYQFDLRTTPFEPYHTPHTRYLNKYDEDTTGNLIGYNNERVLDHPVMDSGTDEHGNDLSSSEIDELLDPPLSPFPGTSVP